MRKSLQRPISIMLAVIMIFGIFTILPAVSASAEGNSTSGWVFSTSDRTPYDMSGKWFKLTADGEAIAFNDSGSFEVIGNEIFLCGKKVAEYDLEPTNSGDKYYGTYQKEFADSVYVTGAGLEGDPFVFEPNYIYSAPRVSRLAPSGSNADYSSAIAIDSSLETTTGSNNRTPAIANPGDGFKKFIRIKTGTEDNSVQFLPYNQIGKSTVSGGYLAVGNFANGDTTAAYGANYSINYLNNATGLNKHEFKDQETATLYYVGQSNGTYQFAESRAFRKSFEGADGDPYIITWTNGDGTLLDIGAYCAGETPDYNGENPTKDATEWNEYEFTGWNPEVATVSGNAVYTATFEEVQTAEHHVTIAAKIFSTSDDNDYASEIGGKFYSYNNETLRFDNAGEEYIFSVDGSSIKLGSVTVATIAETSNIRTYAGTVCVTGAGTNEDPYVFTPNYIYGNSSTEKIKDSPVAHINGTQDNKDAGVAIPGDGFIGNSKIRIGASSLAKFMPGDKKFYSVNGTKGYLGIGKNTYGNNYSNDTAKPKSFTGSQKILYYFGENTVTVSGSSKDVYMFSEYTPPQRTSFSDTATDICNVIWKNYDGSELAQTAYFKDTTPHYKGETPYKPRSGSTYYTHSGWDDGTTAYGINDLPNVQADTTYTATFSETTKDLFAGYSLSLKGDIGLNFHLNVTDAEVAKGVNVHFTWTVKGNENEADYTITSADKDDDKYKATCWVPACEMNHEITATATIDGTVQDETDHYSIKKYSIDVINAPSGTFTKQTELVDLVKKMLDYGAKAQVKFGRTDVPLANTGVDRCITDYDADTITEDKAVMDDMTQVSSYGLQYKGTSIIYDSKTTLRHYYKVVGSADLEEYKANAANTGFTYGTKDGFIYFEYKNIGANNLDDVFKLSFDGNTYYRYSPMAYLKKVLNLNTISENEKLLAMATYWYNDAANTYFD